MQVSDFYAEIGRRLNDPRNERWTTDVLLTRMNRSQTKVVALTNSVKTKETLTATVSTSAVQLDTDVIDIIRVHILRSNGNWFKLDGILPDQLDFQMPNWQQIPDG